MKYGSVCSGIEAASVAWESLGWQAQWYSEIEHFPSAVLAHRFPAVPNLGDMTQIHNSEHFNGNSIDLLVGGTPCQSFSVAGLRKGLDDTRGQLMLTFCELAARKRPRWVVWENVPGVLSSNKGEDLASFLGLLTGREIHPPIGGWKNSGIIEGIGSAYGVAWTVLDAQYFGVAQRRRRIFAVGYLGDWRPAAAVLFESYRLSGDIKEGRKKRKATSADAEGGVGGGGIPRVSGSLDTECGGGKLTHQSVNNGHLVPAWWNGEQTAATLTKQNANGAQRMPDKDNLGAVLQPVTHAFKVRGGSEVETGEQGGTPGKKAGKGMTLGSDELAFTIGTTQDQQIAQPIPIQDQATRHSGKRGEHQDGKGNGLGIGSPGDPIYTLTKGDHHAVAQPIAVDVYNQTISGDKVGIVREQHGTNMNAILQPIAYSFDSLASNSMKSSNPHSGCREVETSKTLDTTTPDPSKNQGGIAVAQPVPFRKAKRAQSKDDHETWEQDEKTNTLNAFDVGDIRTTQAVVENKSAAFIPKNGAKARGIGYAEEQTPTLDTGCSNFGVVHPIAVDVYNQSIDGQTAATITEAVGGSNTSGPKVAQPIAVDTYNQTTSNINQTIKSPQGGLNESIGVVLQPIAVDTYNQTVNEHTTQTIGSSASDVNHYGAVLTPQAIDFRNQNLSDDVTGTLQSKSNGGYSLNYQPGILQPTMAIRRLTPTECERLQGFPDGWTKIPYRNKPEEVCPDGPRYKACGNSMAVPVMRWIGQRIQMVEDILSRQKNKEQ